MPASTPSSHRRAEDRAVPLRRGLLVLIATLAVVVASAFTLLGLTVQDLRQAQQVAQGRLLPATSDAQQLLDLFINQETGERGYLLTADAAFLQPYQMASQRLPDTVTDLQ